MKPFEIFRSGTHTDSRGRPFTFSDEDLTAIAEKYDPALSHAPIVVGHPKEDAPAYGWVKSVRFSDGRLVVETEDLESEFSDLVKAGRFRTRSASFFPPEHPNNPTPGQYYLRHVGFLGAAAPAVKGLKPVEFAGDDDAIEFNEPMAGRVAWALENVARMFRGFRDFVIAEKGVEAADTIISGWSIETVSEIAQELRSEPASPSLNYSETTEDDMTITIAELERRESELAAREASFADSQRQAVEARRRSNAAEDAAFVTSVVEAGRLPVGLKGLATALFNDLGHEAISFSDAGEDKQMTPREGLRLLLERLPVPVVQGELATGDGPDFSDPLHVSEAIKTEIETAKARGETLSPAEAGMRLTRR